jgi:hypothetical protein
MSLPRPGPHEKIVGRVTSGSALSGRTAWYQLHLATRDAQTGVPGNVTLTFGAKEGQEILRQLQTMLSGASGQP